MNRMGGKSKRNPQRQPETAFLNAVLASLQLVFRLPNAANCRNASNGAATARRQKQNRKHFFRLPMPKRHA